MMQWFRLYHEFSTDIKVQMLSEAYQRRLIMLMCLRCSNGDVTLHETEVAFHMRIDLDEWLKTKASFIRQGFIDNDNKLINWNKRQFVSDSSAERVRKHREKKKIIENSSKSMGQNVTLQGCYCNAPDTDTETDIITPPTPPGGMGQKTIYSESFEQWWKLYPKKVAKKAAYKKWKSIGKRKEISVKELIAIIEKQVRYNHFMGNDGQQYIPNASRWLNEGRWLDEIKESNEHPEHKNIIPFTGEKVYQDGSTVTERH